MKTLASLSFLFIFPFVSEVSAQKVIVEKENKFIGTYNGLNKYVEFEFKDENGKNYIFQEIGEDIYIDMYDEANFEKKFEVTWITQTFDILDDEGETVGRKDQINEIISLKEI